MLTLGCTQRVTALLSLIVVVAYVALAGFRVPVIRAGFMIAAVLASVCAGREKSSLNSLFLIYFILLLIDVRTLYQISFQLSFISVLSLVLILPRAIELPRLPGVLKQTLAITIGTFPLIAYYFNIFSPISPIANMGAVFFFYITLLGALASLLLGSLPFLGPITVWVTTAALKCGMVWIKLLSQIPWGFIYVRSPGPGILAVYYVSLILLVFGKRQKSPGHRRLSRLMSVICLIAAAAFFVPERSGPFSLTVLATKRGPLVHVRGEGIGNWIFCTGSREADRLAVPYLRAKGLRKIDGVMLMSSGKNPRSRPEGLSRHFDVSRWYTPLYLTDNQMVLEQVSGGSTKEASVRMWDVHERHPLLKLSYDRFDFLFLPSMNANTLTGLKDTGALAGVEVAVLPNGTHTEGEGARAAQIIRLLEAAQIPFLVRDQTGAITFDVQKGKVLLRSPKESPITGIV